MPFYKFKPQKQFGIYNTRTFKEVLKARNKWKLSVVKPHPELIAKGTPIYDAKDPEFMKNLQNCSIEFDPPEHLKIPSIEVILLFFHVFSLCFF